MKRYVCLLASALMLCLSCSDQAPGTFKKTETIMGTEVSVTVVSESPEAAESAIEAALAEVRRLDRMMSLYIEESEITKVNMAAGTGPVKVSPEMMEVIESALGISRLTHGAFDITVGPLIVLWQMRLKEGRVPGDEEISEIRRRVRWEEIELNKKNSTVFIKRPGMIIDLGGVAKGYAADRAAAVLAGRGIKNGIVSIAGDIRVMGRRPDGSAWRIGIQHPRDREKTLAVLELSDISISTSGDYERFKIVGKKRYHHIIDPRTGRPSEGVISVTVIGDRGVVIDPLTTALFILGPEEGMKIVRKLGYEAVFVDSNGRVTSTDGIVLKK